MCPTSCMQRILIPAVILAPCRRVNTNWPTDDLQNQSIGTVSASKGEKFTFLNGHAIDSIHEDGCMY